MELVDTLTNAITTFANEHPFVALGIAITLIYLIKEPAKILLVGTKDAVTGIASPAGEWLRDTGRDLTRRADAVEEEVKTVHRSGVLAGLIGSTIFFGIVFMLGLLNYALLLRPLQDIVQGQFQGVSMAIIAAVAIIFAEFAVGAMLLNAMGRSQFIPLRQKGAPSNTALTIGTAVMMLVLAGSEAGLAIFRDQLMQKERETRVAARMVEAPVPASGADFARSIATAPSDPTVALQSARSAVESTPMYVQAALGFLLPWIIMAAVLPVEFFRDVLGIVFRRVIVLAMLPFQAVAFLVRVVSEATPKVIGAILDILAMPAQVFFSGLQPILAFIAPKLFKRP